MDSVSDNSGSVNGPGYNGSIELPHDVRAAEHAVGIEAVPELTEGGEHRPGPVRRAVVEQLAPVRPDTERRQPLLDHRQQGLDLGL